MRRVKIESRHFEYVSYQPTWRRRCIPLATSIKWTFHSHSRTRCVYSYVDIRAPDHSPTQIGNQSQQINHLRRHIIRNVNSMGHLSGKFPRKKCAQHHIWFLQRSVLIWTTYLLIAADCCTYYCQAHRDRRNFLVAVTAMYLNWKEEWKHRWKPFFNWYRRNIYKIITFRWEFSFN